MHIYNMFVDTDCIDYGEISATWVINGITLRVINKDECQSQDKNNHRLTNAKVCQQNTADNPLTTFFFQVRVGKCDLRFARQSRHVQIQHVTYCHLRLLKSYFPCTLLCVMYSSFVNFGPLKTWITGNLKAKVFLYLCYGIACHGSMGRLTFQMYDVGYHTLPAQFHLDHESSNLQSSIGGWNTSLRRSFQIIWGFNNVFGKHCQDPLNV